MSDETRVDREALRAHVEAVLLDTLGWDWEPNPAEHVPSPAECISDSVDAVLALLPAPHPQGGTETLRAAHDLFGPIRDAMDSAEPEHEACAWHGGPGVDCNCILADAASRAVANYVRALLAAAPAPTDCAGYPSPNGPGCVRCGEDQHPAPAPTDLAAEIGSWGNSGHLRIGGPTPHETP